MGAVWGNPPRLGTVKDKLRNLLLAPCIYLDTMNLNEDAVNIFVHEWKKIKPTLLFGHAHSLYILALYIDKLKINDINPKGIISTSMMLMPNERQVIENIFGVQVHDRYGCEEVSLIASECEKHEGLHINIEHLFVEFIREDGMPAHPGEEGAIIVTDLVNEAMPFIRYKVEDVGVLSDRKCSCGRGLPLMEKVVGRVADFFVRKDGSLVAGVSLIERTLTAIPGIQQLQIVQNAIDEFVLNIVKDDKFVEESKKGLLFEMNETFGHGVNIKMVFVDKLKQEESGKYRFSICNVKHDIINEKFR